MFRPSQKEMEMNMMSGKGRLGVQRIPTPQAIPKQSQSATRTGNSDSNSNINKKMKKIMKKVMS